MELKKNYILFIIPLVIFLSKWAISYIIFPSDFLITKVLFDTPDSQYYPIVKSLANFNFSPSYNESIKAENLLTFPYGPIILHSIFYKIFGNVSFIILEFVFIFLFFITIFKIFEHIGFSFNSSLFSTLLILFLPTLSELLSNFSIAYIGNLKIVLGSIFSSRFPRPQVTGLYYLVFIYLSLKFSVGVKENTNKKYTILFAFILGLLLNSFFYFFLYCCLALLILLVVNLKKDFLSFLISKINFLLAFLVLLLIVSIPFFLQLYFGETDYSIRIGLVEINLQDKIYLNKFFLKSLLRLEPLIIFFTIIFLTVFIKKFFKKEKLFNKIDIFFYLYLSSILAPFLFITFSSKVIAIYHFANYILVNGLLYISFSSLSILYFYQKRITENIIFKENKVTKRFLTIIILFLFSLQNYNVLKVKSDRDIFNEINQKFIENKFIKSHTYLFTNDMKIANLWIFNKNNNLLISDGYTNSIKNKKIIENLAVGLKLIGISREEFKKILDFKGPHYTKRNPIIQHLFNYQYQANKFQQFSENEQYTANELERINNTSPLRVMANILPQDEKNKFLLAFDNISLEENDYKDFVVILNTKLIPDFIKNKNYEDFSLIYKKDHYIFLKKN
jgi:hypothetical protein